MITKYEAKNTVAVKHGYKDWVELKLNNDDESREMYLDKAMDLYAELSNSHKHSVSGKRPTPELFCKVHSEMYGEPMDNLRQLVKQTMNGEDLYELCLRFHQAACASGAAGTVAEGRDCDYCKGSGYDPYPNHDTTQRPCPKCEAPSGGQP